MNETIKQRLLKIKALAERGQEHEAQIAKQKLMELADKYGIDLDTLADVETKEFKYKYAAAWEKKLMFQVSGMIGGDGRYYAYSKGAKAARVIGFDFTLAMAKEFDWIYKHYKAAYKKELDLLFSAFLHKHKIFGPSSGDEEPPPLTQEEMLALTSMMAGISSETLARDRKQIQ